MKEIKRFQRMQIDLKSNLDRIQWRMDCESKVRINYRRDIEFDRCTYEG